MTNSAAVLNLQLAAACARQSPQFLILAPVADNDPPYKSSLVVKSISNSPDLASALPFANLHWCEKHMYA